MNTNTVVLYHANCNDGYGAAYAYWAHAKASDLERTEFVPMSYNDELPDCINENSHVVFLDFSIKRQPMEELLVLAEKVTVVDHHQSSLELADLEKAYDNFTFIHSLEHSGAVLTWLTYRTSQSQEVPMILLYIEDRDLWKFQYEATKAVHVALQHKLQSRYSSFENFSMLTNPVYLAELLEQGTAMLDMQKAIIDSSMKSIYIIGMLGEQCFIVNTLPTLSSDTCQAIRDLYPLSSMQATYSVIGNLVTYSLRSQGEVDCAKIAEHFGGGGHKNAAGFSVRLANSHLIIGDFT